jgi:hypothetical protein
MYLEERVVRNRTIMFRLRRIVFHDPYTTGNTAPRECSGGFRRIVRTDYPGTSCVVPPQFDDANCIDILIARPQGDRVRSGFLSRFFNLPSGKSQAVTAKHDLAQQYVNVGAGKKVRLPIPTLEVQDEIDNVVAVVQTKITSHQRKHATLIILFRNPAALLDANRPFIANNGDRYWHGETISTGFVESASIRF